jgi:polyisoprenoid-binding protein YceI
MTILSDAEVDFSLDINSIDTNQTQRDEHLKGGEFFDAEKHPKISLNQPH